MIDPLLLALALGAFLLILNIKMPVKRETYRIIRRCGNCNTEIVIEIKTGVSVARTNLGICPECKCSMEAK